METGPSSPHCSVVGSVGCIAGIVVVGSTETVSSLQAVEVFVVAIDSVGLGTGGDKDGVVGITVVVVVVVGSVGVVVEKRR